MSLRHALRQSGALRTLDDALANTLRRLHPDVQNEVLAIELSQLQHRAQPGAGLPLPEIGLELLAAQPLQHGLAELLAYLQLGAEQFHAVADEAVPEAIYWQAQSADGQAITRCAQLPRLIFMR